MVWPQYTMYSLTYLSHKSPRLFFIFMHGTLSQKQCSDPKSRDFFSQITKCRSKLFFHTCSELEWRSNSAPFVSLTYYTLRFDEKNRMQIDFLFANMHKFSRQITKYCSRFSHLTIFLTLATNPLGFSSFFCMGAKNARIRRPETWVTTWIALSRGFQSPQ